MWQGAINRLWIRRPACDIDMAVTTEVDEVAVFQEGERDLRLEVFGNMKGTFVKRSELEPLFIVQSSHLLNLPQEWGRVPGSHRDSEY